MSGNIDLFEDKTGIILVKHIIKNHFCWAKKNKDVCEELISCGLLGVTIGLRDYKKEYDFTNFMCAKIKQSILSYLRTLYSKPICPCLPEYFVYNENNIEVKDSVDCLFKFLNKQERLILTKLYLEEKPYQEVIKETGLSKFQVFDTRRKAFKKLRGKNYVKIFVGD